MISPGDELGGAVEVDQADACVHMPEAERLVLLPAPADVRAASASALSRPTGPPWNTTCGGVAYRCQSGRICPDVGGGRPVQHDAERAALVVVDEQHDGAREVGVTELGRGDEQASGQGLLDPCVLHARLVHDAIFTHNGCSAPAPGVTRRRE